METTCPACGSIIGECDSECPTCGWYEYEGDEPLDPADLDLLHVDLGVVCYA